MKRLDFCYLNVYRAWSLSLVTRVPTGVEVIPSSPKRTEDSSKAPLCSDSRGEGWGGRERCSEGTWGEVLTYPTLAKLRQTLGWVQNDFLAGCDWSEQEDEDSPLPWQPDNRQSCHSRSPSPPLTLSPTAPRHSTIPLICLSDHKTVCV